MLVEVAAIIPVLFLVSLFTFFLATRLPGDPAIRLPVPGATPQAVAEIREELNLEAPFWERYRDWLGAP